MTNKISPKIEKENSYNEICQGYWRTLEVYFENERYNVKIENDDFDNFEVTIWKDNKKILEDNPIFEKILNYLEEEKEI